MVCACQVLYIGGDFSSWALGFEGDGQAENDGLVPDSGSGGHQQLTPNRLISVAVIRQGPNHISGVEDRGSHAHRMFSLVEAPQVPGIAQAADSILSTRCGRTKRVTFVA